MVNYALNKFIGIREASVEAYYNAYGDLEVEDEGEMPCGEEHR